MPEFKVRTVGDNDNNRLWTSYEKDVVVRFNKCLPSGAGLQLNAREDDLKKTKQWMEQSKKPADFFFSFDFKSLSMSLLVKVGSQKDTFTSINIGSADVKKQREILTCLNKDFPALVTKANLEEFAKKNPDQTALDDLKKKIADKAKEIQAVETLLANKKKEKADLETKFKEQGGKP
jgi:hypothetical protein